MSVCVCIPPESRIVRTPMLVAIPGVPGGGDGDDNGDGDGGDSEVDGLGGEGEGEW